MNRVAVGIGSNIRPAENIQNAVELLGREHALLKMSHFSTTAPVGFTEQPDFVNGAVLLQTDLTNEQFRGYLKELERRLGRVKTGNKYGPRTIDLDIVVWNGTVVDKDYYTRDFLKRAVDEVTGTAADTAPQ